MAAKLARDLRPQLSFEDRLQQQQMLDQQREEEAIQREQTLRDMGRFPGVPGPERFEQNRRLQDAFIRAQAASNASFLVNRRNTALKMMQDQSMQGALGAKSAAVGAKTGVGEQIGKLAATVAAAYFTGGAGAAALAGAGALSTSAGASPTAGATEGGSPYMTASEAEMYTPPPR